jgi:serine/threonine-protein kinase
VGTLAIVFAMFWAFALVMANVVTPIFLDQMPIHGEAFPMPGNLIATAGIVLSIVMTALAGFLHRRPQRLLDLSLVFLVLTAFLIGLFQQWRPDPSASHLGWIPVVLLIYPAIAPNTPWKILLAGLVAASMDPLGVLIAHWRGVPFTHDPVTLSLSFVPTYFIALMAVVPSKIILGLGREARRARELGSYKLGEPLGQGGMGTVYRAEHRLLARQAAIKLIRPEVLGARRGDDARVLVERFKREAQAAATLRSSHTIELYDFGTTDLGSFYYVMELLDGTDLDTLVERFGSVPPERAVHFIRQACLSLAEAHGRGLVHRDIKPSNLVASRLGVQHDYLKVLDFGLVKSYDGNGQTLLTQPHVTTGTPAYMAPEVALADDDIDGRADLYALGCVLYWLLTGHLVFEGDNPMKMMHQHISDAPTPPSARTEVPLPAELDAIVMACLAKKRDDRPADAMRLIEMLDGVPVASPWTPQRARQWWDVHLPTPLGAPPCNQGELAPVISE